MSAQECGDTDWEYLGKLDALDGKKDLSRMAKSHHRACKEQGVQVDLRAYQFGWMQGLKEFCTPESGKAFAEKGGRFQPGYCPPQLEGNFLNGYTPARDLLDARQSVLDLQKKIEEKERDIRKLRADKSSNNSNQIAYAQNDLREMKLELRQLQAKLR